jgi:Xaa-Pro aminopeptidase
LNLIGLYEWQIKEVIDTAFDTGGGDPNDAFDHIVASGPNALTLHYFGGDRQIQDGDLLLMDLGAKYQGYCSDISRTFPVNGTFTPRQRALPTGSRCPDRRGRDHGARGL